ncbi:MAG: phosphodiester glycosidase family protein [Mesorhizobium sp.]|uniref:phosphodiester glycosidase family protein n=1 Tax=Mesorhizobium sp. TaxID=1871066 RepID=UPI001AC159B8|nr:phosphodiester glycosidase family protein [Mesorhizobium sp.]MBN9221289.1 phosphodiester glycosidase family protein [Mesorhizobium sp.]
MRKAISVAIVVAILAGLSVAGWIWQRHGVYGLNVLLRRGGTYWVTVQLDDPRLSPAMRLALQPAIPDVTAGTSSWAEVEPGFEVREVPVLAGSEEIDRLYLNRFDPLRFRFVARNETDGAKDIDQWEQALHPDGTGGTVLIVNGSYFGLKGEADTPFVSMGARLGPSDYDAKSGAWTENASGTHVVDLKNRDWRTVLQDADNAMVSYPLLIGEDGGNNVRAKSNWLANRTFIAEDHEGRIVVGSTKDAFFSLDRLANFLLKADLDLKTALNLDGGPIAGLSVRSGSYTLKHYARWEAQLVDGKVSLLRAPLDVPWVMPVVLTVERK